MIEKVNTIRKYRKREREKERKKERKKEEKNRREIVTKLLNKHFIRWKYMIK